MDVLTDLLGPQAVRARCNQLGERAIRGETRYFRFVPERLGHCVQLVGDECLSNYPDLKIPLHSRWRHFVVEGVDLWQHHVDNHLTGLDPDERARVAIDLVFLSVVLDAGAGSAWRFHDPVTGETLTRSEGLAAATVSLFFDTLGPKTGDFSLNADAIAQLDRRDIESAFQHRSDNPLLGMDGRIRLLKGLGAQLASTASAGAKRPGAILDLLRKSSGDSAEAAEVLGLVLKLFNPMWPSGMTVEGVSLGDCGTHELVDGPGPSNHLVPFHKLSQWLTWSLIEPLGEAGLQVIHLDQLTGLPEYRNGGLMLDSGVLEAIDPALPETTLAVDHEAVVEWRALTVWLLDQVAEGVRERLGPAATSLSLGSVLQGGTWSAGRRLAATRRNGAPPLQLAIDGTVF